jgi:polyisoprenoid-binding protein YceI
VTNENYVNVVVNDISIVGRHSRLPNSIAFTGSTGKIVFDKRSVFADSLEVVYSMAKDNSLGTFQAITTDCLTSSSFLVDMTLNIDVKLPGAKPISVDVNDVRMPCTPGLAQIAAPESRCYGYQQ